MELKKMPNGEFIPMERFQKMERQKLAEQTLKARRDIEARLNVKKVLAELLKKRGLSDAEIERYYNILV